MLTILHVSFIFRPYIIGRGPFSLSGEDRYEVGSTGQRTGNHHECFGAPTPGAAASRTFLLLEFGGDACDLSENET